MESMTQEQYEQIDLINASIYHLKALIEEGGIVGVFVAKELIDNIIEELSEAKDTMYNEFNND